MSSIHRLSHLKKLQAEAIHVFRETAAEFERPVLLLSADKDSIVLLRLAEKSFSPGPLPFPVVHLDTGYDFPEVSEYRERRMAELGERLIAASVEDSIRACRVADETGSRASRNCPRTVIPLDAIAEFDCVFGGVRRDEERARAKERILSLRKELGRWGVQRQRPELWVLYSERIRRAEQHVRVFPLSNWTEPDVWHYISEEQLEVPSLYCAHER